MSLAQLAIISNPFDPEVIKFDFPPGKSIKDFVGESKPEYLFLNGEEFEDLNYIPQDDDIVSVYIEPGYGTEWLIWVAYAIVVAFAIYAYSQIPDDPDADDRSNTYSLRGASNIARLGQPVPVQYGEHRVFPDLITQPWIEYRSNEQFLHLILCIGKGEYDITDIRISDTPISNFDDVQTEVLFEGPVTLFPSDVETSIEVTGQTLSTVNVGGFIANSSGTDINRVAIDVAFTTGVYRARSSGDIESTAPGNIIVEYREVDDAGVPVGLGTWLVGTNVSLPTRSLTPLRTTYQFGVSPDGRYEIRVRRSQNENSLQEKIQDHLVWEGLRGFIVDPTTYTNTTIIAIRMRATEQLSNQSARSFNVFAQRKIPTWNGLAWTTPQLTRSPAWAVADVLRNTDYGAGRPDADIDTTSFDAFNTWCQVTKSFNFDGRFDTLVNVWKTIEQIAAVGKGFVVPSFSSIGIVIEDTQTLPAWTFNRANMFNERFQLTYDRSDDYDSIEARYFDDAQDYREDVLIEPAAGTNPRNIDYRRGITDRDHLFIILKFIDAKQKFVNLFVEFDTELEGYLPEKGDLIAIPSDVLGDLSIAGEVLDYNVGTREITLSNAMSTDQAVQHGIMLRQDDGTVTGPHNATLSSTDPFKATFDAAIPFDPSPVADQYNIIAAWGEVDFSFRHYTVTKVLPRDENKIGIEAHIYDARVYDETGTAVGPATRPALPRISEIPDVFNIQFSNGAIPNTVAISWQADQGWEYFVLQWHDGDGFWSPSIQTTVPYFLFPIALNDVFNLTVRVRAVGIFAGAFKTATLTNAGIDDFTSPDESIAGLVDPLSGADYDMEDTLTYTWTQDADVPQFYWTLEDASGALFLDGYTTGNSVVLARSQIVAAATAAPRVGSLIARFDVYPTSFTQNTNFSNGQGFNINNAQMAAPNNVVLTEGLNAFLVTTTATTPPNDFLGMEVYVGSAPAFTPDRNTNLLYNGDFRGVVVIPSEVTVGTIRYVRVGLYDQFGKDGISLFAEQAIIITKNVESDLVIPAQFGSSIVQNSYLDQGFARSTGEVLPAGWYLNGNVVGDLIHSDSNRDKALLTTATGTAEMLSVAFRPNITSRYELTVRIRSTSGTPTVSFGVMEKNSDLVNGKVAITASAADTFIDSEIEALGDAENSTTAALTTSFSIETFTYNPGASAVAASLFIRADAGESYEIDYIYARDASTVEDGAGANSPDLAGLLFNSWMAINDVVRNRPAGWFIGDTTNAAYIGYQDVAKTILRSGIVGGTDSHSLHSTAFQVNSNQIFRVAIRLRGRVASTPGPGGLYIRIAELDTDLPEGKLWISRSTSAGPTYDEQFRQSRTRELIQTSASNWNRVSGGVDFENDPVPVVYTEYIGDYQATSTAKWASVAILNWVDHDDEIWIDRVTVEVNPGALALIDQADTPDIVGAAVSVTTYAESNSSVAINDSTWVDVLIDTIDVGANIGNVEILAFINFNCGITADLTAGDDEVGQIQVRCLDDANVVVDEKRFDMQLFTRHLAYSSVGAAVYRNTITQNLLTRTNINVWNTTVLSPQGFSVTKVSNTEFELDDAGVYEIHVQFSTQREVGGGASSFFLEVIMQDRTSGGGYADTPGVYFLGNSINGIYDYSSGSLTAILDVAANHRFKFQGTSVNSSNEMILQAGKCLITIKKLDGPYDNGSGSVSAFGSMQVGQVYRVPQSSIVSGNNDIQIECKKVTGFNTLTANLTYRSLTLLARKV